MKSALAARADRPLPSIYWLQGLTLVWMSVEMAVALYAAHRAHSAALLAFGSDSLVELLSAVVVLLAFMPGRPVDRERADRWAGMLLFILAAVVAVTAVASLLRGVQPETSTLGMGITVAALIIMPLLAAGKRTAAGILHSKTLAADAVQSATCAYLAALTLAGLGINALFGIPRADAVAALAAVPILVLEGRRTRRGDGCCAHCTC